VEELPCDLAAERVFLGLRLAEGVAEAELALLPGQSPARLDRVLETLRAHVTRRDGRLRLTTEGRLVSNAVLSELLP
jgi:coproporphyrinogen III oxidase-like Fe-S oxidoreductase